MKKKVILFVVSILIMLVGYLIAEKTSFTFKTCGVGYPASGTGDFPLAPACMGYRGFLSNIDEIVGVPIFFYAIALCAVSLLLFLVADKIFSKWLKFALIYTVFAWLIILITPVSPGGFLDPNREQVSIWMSSLFLIISLILIIVWQIKEKKSLK